MESLQNNGVDIIELGMPYSDPLADGLVIQESSAVALHNGMTIAVLLQQLQLFREKTTSTNQAAIILMGYMNPILQYGFERFCADASKVGVDGLILPDLPEYEFETEFQPIIKRYGLDFIFLITPETSNERILLLDSLSSGFLYAVSSSATTGNETNFASVEKYIERLASMNLQNPIMVGFGIKDHATFTAACKYGNGAIIGSAYIKALAATKDIETTTAAFIKDIIQ
jgi:tryptophan synthase alpha chain